MSLELLFEIPQIPMPIHDDLRTRQATPVDDARVVELIGEDHVARLKEGRERADVGGVSGAEDTSGRRCEPSSEAIFQKHVLAMVADHQAGRACTHPVLLQSARRGLHEPPITGEPQIVVRGEVQHRTTIENDLGTLLPIDHAGEPTAMSRREGVELGSRLVVEGHARRLYERVRNASQLFDLLRTTASRINALSAFSLIFSPS